MVVKENWRLREGELYNFKNIILFTNFTCIFKSVILIFLMTSNN